MTDTPVSAADVDRPGFDPTDPVADPAAAGRPDPNVARPAASHRLDVDGQALTAGLYRAVDGHGEDVWQVTDAAGAVVVAVVADRIADAVADRRQHGDLQRSRARQFLDLADDADRERAAIEALADAAGVDVTKPSPVEEPAPRPPHPAR